MSTQWEEIVELPDSGDVVVIIAATERELDQQIALALLHQEKA